MPKFQPYHDIVLVDCHVLEMGRPHQVKSIIDHHIITKNFPYYVAVSHEVSWSSTVQVYIKFLGSGLDLDAHTAKILFEATRLEAEPSLIQVMTRIDQLAIARLERLAQQSTSYEDLMQLLLDGGALADPFMEDYKQTLYGFAVIKTRHATSYQERAARNNLENHLPLTVVKQVVYNSSHFDSNLDEPISLYFNDNFYDKGFRSAIEKIVQTACEAFHGAQHVTTCGSSIIVTNVPSQTPRLLLMPTLETVMKEHLRFFFSPCVGKYVSCGFFSASSESYGTPSEELPPTTCISFDDVKAILANQSNSLFLSLQQYWEVYHERETLGDTVSLRSLRDKKYVELLDTVIYQKTVVVHSGQDSGMVDIEGAKPALIRTDNIDTATGFPRQLISPDTYGDPTLWRYWSPDAQENVATRGHIFVMDQTCIDLKIRRHERTRQMTFRPVYRDVPEMRYQIDHDGGKWIVVKVYPRLLSVQA